MIQLEQLVDRQAFIVSADNDDRNLDPVANQLMDEIDANKALGKTPYDSVIDAGLSRVRPICVGAATTILGVIPLLTDAFWVSMAMTMMAGLTFGTLLTCLLLPTFYATLYRIPTPK